MKEKKDKRLLAIEVVFREADIKGLLKMGAPLDEYDSEALLCYERSYRYDTVESIQQKIWNIFYTQFCVLTYADGIVRILTAKEVEQSIGTVADYKEMATKIKEIVGG